MDRAGGVKSPDPFGSEFSWVSAGRKGQVFSAKIAGFDYNPTPKGIGLPDIAAMRFSAAMLAI